MLSVLSCCIFAKCSTNPFLIKSRLSGVVILIVSGIGGSVVGSILLHLCQVPKQIIFAHFLVDMKIVIPHGRLGYDGVENESLLRIYLICFRVLFSLMLHAVDFRSNRRSMVKFIT